MSEEASKPGRGGYLVAAALVLFGLALFAAAVVPAMRAVSTAVEGLQRVEVAGVGSQNYFRATSPGRVMIHYEPISRIGGTPVVTEPTWEPTLVVRKTPELVRSAGTFTTPPPPLGEDEKPTDVEVERTASTVVYRVGEFAGHSLLEADLPAAGTYFVEVTDMGQAGDVAAGTIGPATFRRRVLAIGNVPVGRLKDGFLGVYGGAVALGLLGCAATIVALITWARRHGTKTERIDGQPTAW